MKNLTLIKHNRKVNFHFFRVASRAGKTWNFIMWPGKPGQKIFWPGIFRLIYRLICIASCFNPRNMVHHHAESSQLFKMLADHVFALHKIKASVADKSKSQMDEFLKIARFDQKEKLRTLIFAKIVWMYFLVITSRSALRNYGRFLRMYVHFRMDKASQKGASQSTKRWLITTWKRNR